jgi:hypothetical protein
MSVHLCTRFALLTKRLSNIELTGNFRPDIFIGKLLNDWKRML